MAIQVDPNEIQEQGYIVLRNVIPPAQLDSLRTSYETLVDRQRAIWARDRGPDDPPGGVWETSDQPRLVFNKLVDESTADAIDFLLDEPWNVSRQLLQGRDIGLHAMFLMCSPTSDRGPANWHRDTAPTFDAPLQGLELDMAANGPGYVQWNIPLYDDNVLWVVPGSHRRPNTDDENRQLVKDPREPLPGGMQVELKAGDGVVYTTSSCTGAATIAPSCAAPSISVTSRSAGPSTATTTSGGMWISPRTCRPISASGSNIGTG